MLAVLYLQNKQLQVTIVKSVKVATIHLFAQTDPKRNGAKKSPNI
jgi:hypothetical protein